MKQDNTVPQILIFANDMQRAGDYALSRKYYERFFRENPTHCLRFKALYEIADNYYHEKNYKKAKKGYEIFQNYCKEQRNLTDEEAGWVEAYSKLSVSRMKEMKK